MSVCQVVLLTAIVLGVACGSSPAPPSSTDASQGPVAPTSSPPSSSNPPGPTISGADQGAAPSQAEPPTSPTAGGAGSGTPSACDALAIAPVRPVVVEYSWPAVCDGAISSPDGDVALGTHSFLNAPPIGGFGLFATDGTRLGAAAPTLPPGPVVDPVFHPAASGFQGIAAMSTGLQCAAWSRTGALQVIACPGHPVTSAPTVAGGTVFVVGSGVLGTDQLLAWADSNGKVSDGKPMDGSASLVLESWNSSHVVVVDLSGAIARARWFDGNGNALTAWFTAKARTPAYGASLKLLVDGTVALYDGVAWTALLRDGVESAEDPPAWLARLTRARLATLRRGRGYAVLRDDLGGAATFEIVTARGESCGNVTLPAESVRRLDSGYDGTLFAVEARPAVGGTPQGCAFRWWPALFW